MKRKYAKYASVSLAFTWSFYIILMLAFDGTAYARSSTEIRADLASAQQQLQDLQSQLSGVNLKISESESTFSDKKSLYENYLKIFQAKESEVAIASDNYDNNLIKKVTTSDSIINAEIYNNQGYGNRPPLPGLDRLYSTTTVQTIDFQWGSGRVLDTLYDRVAVKFTGSITVPEDRNITFYAPGDDGIKVYIDDQLIINDWYDKGGGGNYSASIPFKAGETRKFTLWFYENGGGANVWFYWNYNGSMQIIPSWAFGTTTNITYEKDPALFEILTTKQAEYYQAQNDLFYSKQALDNAQSDLDALYIQKTDIENQISDLNKRIDDLNAELEKALAEEAIPPWWSNQVYEGQDMTITLDSDKIFSKVTAWYGAPNNAACGADVSGIVTDIFKDKQSATINANNGVFGDPCGGVFKVLRVSYESVSAPITTPTPEPSIEPTPTPIVEPTQEPTPEPSVSPTPEPSASPEPSAVPTPKPSEQPTPEPSAIPTPEPTPEPSKEPAIEPVVTPVVETPVPAPEATPVPDSPAPVVEPVPVDTPTVEEVKQQEIQQQLHEQMANPIPEISAAAIGESAKQAVTATAKFVKDLFTNPAAAGKALLAIGTSMSEEERAKARPVVIATVVVNIISSSVTGMTIRGVKIK